MSQAITALEIAQINPDGDYTLQLNPISVNEEYLKEWNCSHMNDFVVLAKNGKILRNTLYRKGGMNFTLKVGKDKYFMLLKYTEDLYDLNFINKCYPKKSREEKELLRKHLKHEWVILDWVGNEKITFEQFIGSPYLISSQSPIYHIENKYYNIETGYLYCNCAITSMKSSEYLFLNNNYDDDVNKRGILKIHLLDGSWEIFP